MISGIVIGVVALVGIILVAVSGGQDQRMVLGFPALDGNGTETVLGIGQRVIGTVPRAFARPMLGRVGLHVMYREFAT